MGSWNNLTDGTGEEVEMLKPTWPMIILSLDFAMFILSACAGFASASNSQNEKGDQQSLKLDLQQSETIMEDTTGDSTTVDPTKKELPVATKEQLRRPPIAYPTILLLVVAYSLYFSSLYLYIYQEAPWMLCTFASTIATYWSFTVLHDSVHIAIAPRIRWVNELCGYLAGLPFFAPLPFFRYIHLNHHRYAGDEELDPDAYAGRGPMVLLPFRWATNLYFYIYYFARTVS
jgi:fatty acid desaturase